MNFTIIFYENNEAYQLGHGTIVKNCSCLTDTKNIVKSYSLNRENILSITFKNHLEYEGFIGELSILGTDKVRNVDLNDFWICPDPNYHGNTDNNFYGTIREYKELLNKATEIDRE